MPITLIWQYDDPDDIANDPKRIIDYNGDAGDDNAAVSNGGKLGAWKAYPGYTAQAKSIESPAEVITTGENKGRSKVIFSASVIAGDNYILNAKILDKTNKVLRQAWTGIWTVRKKIAFENIYQMEGSFDMARIMTKESIDPAFSKNGCTDYAPPASVTKLSKSLEFIAPLLPPTESELPSPEEILAFFGSDANAKAAAESSIEVKAQFWYLRNYKNTRQQILAYVRDMGIKPGSIISARYLHLKEDSDDKTGSTNYYPPGIMINTAEEGDSPMLKDPDGDWLPTTAIEEIASKNVWIFLNIADPKLSTAINDRRRQLAGRHEVGHASDHEEFGFGDHATEGLMHPSGEITPKNPGGIIEFSAESIVKLRGRKR